MTPDDPTSIQTRPTLLNRLKQGDDPASWQEFYRIYGKLVREFALQAGLTETEAEEVVQETAIAMARNLPEYRYNPKVCRFKTWLLNQASWRIKDQLRKRKKNIGHQSLPNGAHFAKADADTTSRTPAICRVADPATENLDDLFESEWRKNLFALALDRVRRNFSLKQFQVFDLLVNKEWSASQVARSLGITVASVYVIRHRVSGAVKKEARCLEKEFEQDAQKTLAENRRAEKPA